MNNIILGGGLAGLTAGYRLSCESIPFLLIEREADTGGLSRTIKHQGFRFDIGGHRFLTSIAEIDKLVRNLLKDDLLTVKRKSKILLNGKMIDYPLRLKGALTGIGPFRSAYALLDYLYHRIFYRIEGNNLQSWVRKNFGYTLYRIYFKEYTEKVWGLPPALINQDWISKRIQGLSLSKAIFDMFKKDRNRKTLAEEFLYPRYGIGQIADALEIATHPHGEVLKEASVLRIFHNNNRLERATIITKSGMFDLKVKNCISTIPLNYLVKLLYPSPPDDVLQAADELDYRDLILVVLFYNTDIITDLTWLYFPDSAI
ncbi:MAG: NAD(P)-binding protein, partial [Nitrospirae bacterium]|nr:NAD(P)-binding protein [Nitrospirota bacterium]